MVAQCWYRFLLSYYWWDLTSYDFSPGFRWRSGSKCHVLVIYDNITTNLVKTTNIYYLTVFVGQESGVASQGPLLLGLTGKPSDCWARAVGSSEAGLRNHLLANSSGCWQHSIPCDCRITDFLLAVGQGCPQLLEALTSFPDGLSSMTSRFFSTSKGEIWVLQFYVITYIITYVLSLCHTLYH